MDIDYKRIGRHLKAARKHKGLTQAAVSEKLRIAENTYSNMERGEQKLNLPRIIQLCEIYEIKPGSVLDDCSDALLRMPEVKQEPTNPDKRELHLLADKCSDEAARIINTTAQALYGVIGQKSS